MEQFEEGRYTALGRAIYRAVQFDPKAQVFNGVDVHGLLSTAFQAMVPFLQMVEKMQEKELGHSTSGEMSTRQEDMQNLKDEVKWVTAAIDLIGEVAKKRKVNAMDQSDIKK